MRIKPPTRTISTRVPDAQYALIVAAAKAESMSVSALMFSILMPGVRKALQEDGLS